MKKKLAAIGEKSGLEKGEVSSLTRIGMSGIMAIALSALISGAGAVSAADAVARPGEAADKKLPEKCTMLPEKIDCDKPGMTFTYYFDQKENRCKSIRGCFSQKVFDTLRICANECGGPGARMPVKYGMIRSKDFNAK